MEVIGVFGVNGGGSSADVVPPVVFDVGNLNCGIEGFTLGDDLGGACFR